MDKLKKLNGSMIAAIVLSVLLIMSITTGATLAWFASRDSAKNSLVMGEAVVVTIGEDYKQGDGELAMNLPVDRSSGGLLPGMSVTPNVKVQLQKSNTNALLRARFITSVEYPNQYVDEAFSNTTKYPNAAGVTDATTHQGRVLTNEEATVFKSEDGKGPVKNQEGKITNYSATGKDYIDEYGERVYITSADLSNASGYTIKYKYNVFAGYMIYDYYNYLGHRLAADMVTEITDEQSDAENTDKPFDAGNLATTTAAHTKVIHLQRVKVRDEIANKIGLTDGKDVVTVNGVTVTVTNENAAELEIRQRGVDLTNAINRVLQGQRGYKLGNDGVLRDDASGLKYSRRVADGWAYRDADQAWYYLGSSTNGYKIADNTSGVSEVPDTTTPVAKDIIDYSEQNVGSQGKKVKIPVYAGVSDTNNQYKTSLTTNGDASNDMTRNYLGGSVNDSFIDRISNEKGVLEQETISSVDLSKGDVSIDFLTRRFILPSFIDNSYAKAKVTFTFTVEAVQDYLVDPLQEATAAADRLPNNLVNAILVFNNAFPQMLFPQTDNPLDKLRATGSSVNVIPAGGESVTWLNNAEGQTNIKYNDSFNKDTPSITVTDKDEDGNITMSSKINGDVIGAEGNQYSYGHLKDDTITGTNGTKIKGFGVKVDEYGFYVADYKKEATYVRGTASSLGVCPFLKRTTPGA